jgi:hypothetical protein
MVVETVLAKVQPAEGTTDMVMVAEPVVTTITYGRLAVLTVMVVVESSSFTAEITLPVLDVAFHRMPGQPTEEAA